MAVFDYPEALFPQAIEWGSTKTGVQHRSPFSGFVESILYPGETWRVSLTLPPAESRGPLAAQAEAFFGRLAGGVDRVRVGHFLRPVPLGTMRGTPTLAIATVRGQLALSINTTGTLLAGDLFKIGGQVFQCFGDCAPVGGVLTVPLVQRVRRPAAVGVAVEWDRPTALFAYPAMSFAAGYAPGVATSISVELEEVPQ